MVIRRYFRDKQVGFNEKRVKITSISAGEGEKFAQEITEFKEEIEKLGSIKPGEIKKIDEK